jgi:hypothetical protein
VWLSLAGQRGYCRVAAAERHRFEALPEDPFLAVASRFGVGVGTGPQHHHEQRGLPDPSGVRILHRHRRSGPIDEALLPSLVLLAKNYVLLPSPLPIQLAKSAVAITPEKIRAAGSKGITKTDLTRSFQHVKSRERDDRLRTLIESGRIRMVTRETAGRSAQIYVDLRSQA